MSREDVMIASHSFVESWLSQQVAKFYKTMSELHRAVNMSVSKLS